MVLRNSLATPLILDQGQFRLVNVNLDFWLGVISIWFDAWISLAGLILDWIWVEKILVAGSNVKSNFDESRKFECDIFLCHRKVNSASDRYHMIWANADPMQCALQNSSFSKILDEMNSSLAGSIVPWIGLGGRWIGRIRLIDFISLEFDLKSLRIRANFPNHLWKCKRLSAWYDDNDLYFLQWQRLGYLISPNMKTQYVLRNIITTYNNPMQKQMNRYFKYT